ncbi:MAG: ABC transporter ATP-binding protein, partial [Actinomycetaceae bacterium]|nr:ABC transporter ATP-binding protein [Actinomycetaceae bacterium]
MVIQAISVSKHVRTPQPTQILNNCTVQLNIGSFSAIVGSSGAGKSSLLQCLGGLDKPDSGTVILDGVDIYSLSENKRARFVRERLAFVFQEYNLLDFLTVEENILFVNQLLGRAVDRAALIAVLEKVGLTKHQKSSVDRLSGGEKQRVAVARALYARSSVILADEPTGALDSVNTSALVQTFQGLAKVGIAVLIVTHDIEVAAAADQVIFMHNGAITRAIQTPSQMDIQQTLLELHG